MDKVRNFSPGRRDRGESEEIGENGEAETRKREGKSLSRVLIKKRRNKYFSKKRGLVGLKKKIYRGSHEDRKEKNAYLGLIPGRQGINEGRRGELQEERKKVEREEEKHEGDASN